MGCIALVRCVLVLYCGLAGVVWYGIRMQAETLPQSINLKCVSCWISSLWNNPLKLCTLKNETKKFLQNAGYSLRYCLPWQFRPLHYIAVPTRSMNSPSLEEGGCPFLELQLKIGWREINQQYTTNPMFIIKHISTCFGHPYAHHQPAQPVQSTIFSNTRSWSHDDGHNDARNMLR